MGCQCSQANSIVPQQPQILDQNAPKLNPLSVLPQIPQQKPKPSQLIISHNKENQKPKELTHDIVSKRIEVKSASVQAKQVTKQQKEELQVPHDDLAKQSKVFEEAHKQKNKTEMPLQAKSERKLNKEASLDPSSKSVKLEQPVKVQPKQKQVQPKTTELIKVEDLTLSNEFQLMREQYKEFTSKRKLKSIKSVKSVKSVKLQTQKSIKVQLNTFVLEQWQQKAGQAQLSQTQKQLRADETQLQRDEISRYLDAVWNYEKELLNSIIDKLQFHEHKRFEQPSLLSI